MFFLSSLFLILLIIVSAVLSTKKVSFFYLSRYRMCIDAISQFGETTLFCAAANGHVDCARLLLEAGADMETKDSVRVSVPVEL
jgi:ankyrin repeat protein